MVVINDLQKKRASNIIWTAAASYGFAPDFKAYDTEGNAELYRNLIIGLAHKYYDYDKFLPLFELFDAQEDAYVYSGLFWLGLENALFQKEAPVRPALESLRREYAKEYLRINSKPEPHFIYANMAYAHFQKILCIEPHLDGYERKLLDELEFSPALTDDEIVASAKELFERWFQLNDADRRARGEYKLLARLGRRKKSEGELSDFGSAFTEHARIKGDSGGQYNDRAALATKMTPAQLRSFMAVKFGKSIYSESETRKLEQELCRGNHLNCCLHFTKGESVGGLNESAFEAYRRNAEAEQRTRNRNSYNANLIKNRTAIAGLREQIRNSVLLYLERNEIRSESGTLIPGRLWRGTYLNDAKVFTRYENDNAGDLSVDILLDSSTSQKNRQEQVSAQGYIIAEALTQCGVPCRIMSFCSMTGYTVMRIFRDYNEPGKNSAVFDFIATGCNRDGLAIRAAHKLINSASYTHRLLILLSDVRPHDIVKINSLAGAGDEYYEDAAGIKDTAIEVRSAMADGISVICVFTGEDKSVEAARLVYGQNFARIQSIDMLASTIGKLIRTELKNL